MLEAKQLGNFHNIKNYTMEKTYKFLLMLRLLCIIVKVLG